MRKEEGREGERGGEGTEELVDEEGGGGSILIELSALFPIGLGQFHLFNAFYK